MSDVGDLVGGVVVVLFPVLLWALVALGGW
jgi:hypothetical protein